MSDKLALGIDLGGTQLRAALVSAKGEVVKRSSVATNVAGGPDAILAQMVHLATDIGSDNGTIIDTIGVSAPGPLDTDTGVVLEIATMPGWVHYPLRQKLKDALNRPIILENDAISAAFGEWKFGAGAGVKNLVYVTVSTGIGGGMIVDGHVLRGNRGMANHVGHMMIDPNGPRCGCGGIGCFEALASGTNFALAGRAKGFADGHAIVEAARKNDSGALALVAQEAEYLAYGFASLIHLYSPERLIIGGGVSNALDLMLEPIKRRVAELIMPPFRGVEISGSALGDNSGLIGAAGLALEAPVHR
jgi:glucokinase